jgi:hypothetical protein
MRATCKHCVTRVTAARRPGQAAGVDGVISMGRGDPNIFALRSVPVGWSNAYGREIAGRGVNREIDQGGVVNREIIQGGA